MNDGDWIKSGEKLATKRGYFHFHKKLYKRHKNKQKKTKTKSSLGLEALIRFRLRI